MKVYISVDMEGIGGIGHPDPTEPADSALPGGGRAMVGETNAAIEGASRAGRPTSSSTTATGSMCNLLPARAPPRGARSSRARSRGRWSTGAGTRRRLRRRALRRLPRPGRSPDGDDRAHLLRARRRDALDGRPTGENGLNALALGAWGVPVGLVAGDDALAEESRGLAAMGRAGRRQDASPAGTAPSRPPGRSPASSSGREPAGGPAGRRRRARASCASARRSSSRSTIADAVEADSRGHRPRRGANRRPGRPLHADDPIEAYRGFLAGIRLAGTVALSAVHTGARQLASTTARRADARDRRSGTARPARRPRRGAGRRAGVRGPEPRRSLGQERAILRLFGVSGLDASAGRSPARSSIAGWPRDPRGLGGGHRAAVRDGAARVRPRPRSSSPSTSPPARSTSRWRRSCCANRIDEPSPRSRPAVWRPPRSSASMPTGPPAARSLDILGDAPRPWLGATLRRTRRRRRARGGGQPRRGRYRPHQDRGPDRSRAGGPAASTSASMSRPGDPRDGGRTGDRAGPPSAAPTG